jgi:ribosome biogenesis protein BRX1
MYFEVKKKVNLALWLGRYPEGPSIKFMVDGVIQTRDIQFQGNSIRGARHIISFDAKMDTEPKFQLAK